MIREKMFRLHRHKSSAKSGERIDFNFSSIQALQVPKGWDKLYLSLLSAETGKTITKSGKASVRNGTCKWTETLSESIWISQDEASKEHHQYFLRLLVTMGSARSSILGETTIDMAGYMSSRASIPVSLPLKKCNHGTILQVEIQCLTPRTDRRDEKLKHTNSYVEAANSDCDDADNRSEVSDCTFTKSVGSSSSNHLDGICHPGDLGSRETSFSASVSRYSFDSTEGSLGKESFSPQSIICETLKHANNGRQYSGSSHAVITSPLRSAGSSTNFLETEETTIEELQAEAGIWERNARKLMLDQEILIKEFADQSKQLVNLDVELSASRAECDGLKQEIEHLKALLSESMDKQKATKNLKFQSTDMDSIQNLLEDELKFQKQSNHDLALQLKKTQDSNIELVSILQEMEETIERQKVEIENLALLKSKSDDTGQKCSVGHQDNAEVNSSEEVSAEKMRKTSCDSDMEGSTVGHPIPNCCAKFEREENCNAELKLQLQKLQESEKNLESTILHLEKTLDDINREIVIERNLKTQTLRDFEAEWRCKLTAKEEEIINLEEKLSKALNHKDLQVAEFDNRDDQYFKELEALKEKVQGLERDCNELTDENLELLMKIKEARSKCHSASFNSSSNEFPANTSLVDPESEVSNFKYQICQFGNGMANKEIPIEGVDSNNLQMQVDCCQGESKGAKSYPADVYTKLEKSESWTATDKTELQPVLFEQLQLLFVNMKKQQYDVNSSINTEHIYAFNNSYSLKCPELATLEELVAAVLDNLVEMNKLLEGKKVLREDALPGNEMMIRSSNGDEVQNELECDNLKKNTLCACSQGVNDLVKELESRVADLIKELSAKTSQIRELSDDRLLNEEEINALRHHQSDLETQVSDLQKTKEQMETHLETIQRESSVESHVSGNKVLEMKSMELESAKCELELHLSELEEENVHLSGRISGLEAQLRYLTDAKEKSRLELQHSESHVMNLQAEMRRLENEMEAQKVTMKQKMEEMQKRWLETQEECEYLKKVNPKLLATAESLIEECSSLQKSNRELRQQKIELHENCCSLEVELKESRNRISNCSEKIEALEAKYSALLDEINSKEKILNSELDALHQQNKEYHKLVLREKKSEVEIVQQEVADLTGQEFRGNFKSLETAQMDSETKILTLMTELAASKENHETLVDNQEKLLRLLEDVRSNEEKLKGTISELESKLRLSEHERLQLAEEISCLKIELLKIPPLQNEVLALKSSLYGTNYENNRLQTSLELLSGDYEGMKSERISLLEKISIMQKAMSEFENCKHSKVALEEKILRLEGDLTASEALCSQDAELKNELGRIRRVNSQFQWKIKRLEEEKEEWIRRSHALEEELKQKNEVKQEQLGSTNNLFLADSRSCGTSSSVDQEQKHSQDNNEHHDNTTSSPKKAVDTVSRIKVLENELAEALEANGMYKSQLKSLLSEVQVGRSDNHEELEVENQAINKEENKQKAVLLEAELREIRERYSHLSLKYAEVEDQREQLVMKLKVVNSGKRWFS